MEKLKHEWFSPGMSKVILEWHSLFDIKTCYYEKYGDLFIPDSLVCQMPDGELAALGLWLMKLKMAYKELKPKFFNFIKDFVDRGLLSLEIDKSEFYWCVMYHQVFRYQFHNSGKTCNVAYDYVVYGLRRHFHVGEWLNEQRAKYAKGTLRYDRRLIFEHLVKKGLLNLNVDGKRQRKVEEKWSAMFQHLLQYEAESGHCNVPTDYILTVSDDTVIELGKWLDTQRQKHGTGHLKPDWKRRLQEKVTENKLYWDTANNEK